MLTVAIAAATMITLRDVLILAQALPSLYTERFSSPQSLPGSEIKELEVGYRPGLQSRKVGRVRI
jgi:hypothetical protein